MQKIPRGRKKSGLDKKLVVGFYNIWHSWDKKIDAIVVLDYRV